MTRGTYRRITATATLAVAILAFVGAVPASPQSSSPASAPVLQQNSAQAPTPGSANSDEQTSGTITGTVLDQSGAVVSGASVLLTRGDQTPPMETFSDQNGRFFFSDVLAGPFQLAINLPGFLEQTSSGVLNAGDTFLVPPVSLSLAAINTEVQVRPQEEVAEGEIKAQEKQRIIGVVPNFYVTYSRNPAPLDAKQKFELAWKTSIDPMTFAFTAATAGIQQWQDQFSGYGKGAQAYPKYYGAAYGDVVAGTFLGSAILPSLLRQDPRYFYKGTGSRRFRFLYALANAVICKGDNKRWEPNYSNILGNIAAGGISNLYYPAQNRNGVALTFESGLIGIGASAAGNLFEEFLSRKFTPNLPTDDGEKAPRRAGKVPFIFTHEGQ